jgi:hypothetical protein
MTERDLPYEYDLINQAMTTPIEIESTAGNGDLEHMKITCKISEDDVETSTFGLFYTLSLLSFRDARSAGGSELQYEERDGWLAIDMLRCLQFHSGQLLFEADYVRGRRMKTNITLNKGGVLALETSGRGTSATRWLSTIQGKNVLTLMKGSKNETAAT